MTTTEQSKQTLQSHLRAFGRGDLDALMDDYADDAVLHTTDGTRRGKAEIRPLFEQLVASLPPGSNIELRQMIVDGELAYVVWTGESERYRFPFATDTLVLRDGKIVAQTFAAQLQVKGKA